MTGIAVRSVDYHTAGEPFRIVAEPPAEFRGATVAERRAFAASDPGVDGLRQLLCHEPRGHADMYGAFITAADDDGAHFGTLFWHKDGFSTACGHGTIALGVWALQSGRVAFSATGLTDVVIDVPSGRVTARVHATGQRVTAVDFVNVPSYVTVRDVPLSTTRGEVVAAISFGGAFYASVDAASLGLRVRPEQLPALIAAGREIKQLLALSPAARHPSDQRLDGIYGTIFFEGLGRDRAGNLHQRNVTIFADGEVDRSPCGSGTCARLADLADSGQLAVGEGFVHESILGTRFQARVLSRVSAEGRQAVLPEVTGMAYKTGEHTFFVDPDDDLTPGFVLR